MSDHFAVKQSLTNLDNETLTDLGGALGISYPKLRRMPNILDGMVAAWLRREDGVLRVSGEPTWSSLVEALEEIGQRGVAEDIMEIKSSYKGPLFTSMVKLLLTGPKIDIIQYEYLQVPGDLVGT